MVSWGVMNEFIETLIVTLDDIMSLSMEGTSTVLDLLMGINAAQKVPLSTSDAGRDLTADCLAMSVALAYFKMSSLSMGG